MNLYSFIAVHVSKLETGEEGAKTLLRSVEMITNRILTRKGIKNFKILLGKGDFELVKAKDNPLSSVVYFKFSVDVEGKHYIVKAFPDFTYEIRFEIEGDEEYRNSVSDELYPIMLMQRSYKDFSQG